MNKLLKNMSSYYYKSSVMLNLTDALQVGINDYDENIKSTLRQFYIQEADKTIERYEKEYRIDIDRSKSIEERRNVVLAKMRGTGTVTKAMIKNVAMSFAMTDVDVLEYPREGYFKIKFLNKVGIPKSFEDLKKAINEIKPSHLNVEYELKYNTHKDLSKYTHKQLSQLTYKQLIEGDLNELIK